MRLKKAAVTGWRARSRPVSLACPLLNRRNTCARRGVLHSAPQKFSAYYRVKQANELIQCLAAVAHRALPYFLRLAV